MSTSLAFWKGPSTDDDGRTYLAFSEGLVEHVESVDAGQVLAALEQRFREWTRESNIWIFEPDSDGNGPSFDLELGPQMVHFTCYGLSHVQLNEIIDAMLSLGFPLYDPQINERFSIRS